jgi:hypothetical protein
MQAMVLRHIGTALEWSELADPLSGCWRHKSVEVSRAVGLRSLTTRRFPNKSFGLLLRCMSNIAQNT